MEVDALAREREGGEWPADGWTPEAWPGEYGEEWPVDWMGKAGGKKGKKGGYKGKGKGYKGKGKGAGPCHWCNEMGHLKQDCQK